MYKRKSAGRGPRPGMQLMLLFATALTAWLVWAGATLESQLSASTPPGSGALGARPAGPVDTRAACSVSRRRSAAAAFPGTDEQQQGQHRQKKDSENPEAVEIGQ